jgi:hypothetical protein
MPLVLLEDFYGVIVGATVDHNIFEVGIVLIEDALNGFLDITSLIIRGRHDRNQRASSHRCESHT